MTASGPTSEAGRGWPAFLWAARWVLLLAPFVASAAFPGQRMALLVRFGLFPVLGGAVVTVAGYLVLWVALGRAQQRLGVSADEEGAPRVPQRRDWLLGLAVAVVFCWSAARYLEYFPASIDSEAQDALRSAMSWLRGAEEGQFWGQVAHRMYTYNAGLTPLVFPLVAWFGPHPLAYKWLNTGFFALVLAALAVTFARQNVAPSRRWLLLLLPILSIILPSLQMYRWHCVCLAGAVVLLQGAAALEGPPGRFYGSLLAFAALLTLYHGQMIYQAGLLGLAAWHVLSPESGQRRWARVGGLLGCAALCWLLYLYQNAWTVTDEANRGMQEARLLPRLLEPAKAHAVVYSLLEAPERFIQAPIFGLWLLGLAATCERAGRWPADRLALLLGGSGFAVHALCQPIINPSCRCWYLLPFLWIGLNGLACAAVWLRRTLGGTLGTSAAVLGLLALSISEWQQYDKRDLQGTTDSPARPWNTSHQLDYVFRHLAGRAPEPRPTLHLIPGPAFQPSEGGFARHLELIQLDWRQARAEFREIDTPNELRSFLRALHEGRLRHRRAVLYLSQLGPDREWKAELIQPALQGLPLTVRVLDLQGPPVPQTMRCLEVTVTAGPP
ncbi:MAG: hypothetical protein JSR82_16080 [Verrucomicrobia bacterium]|nr:hypothetical protein [Verrucomicrobiota bacterium]